MDPFHPGNFFVGNDGGVYSFNPSSGNWSALNASLSTALLQGVGPNPSNDNVTLAGSAGNGTVRFNGAQTGVTPQPWNAVDNGDSGFALFDRVNPTFAYHSFMTTLSRLGRDLALDRWRPHVEWRAADLHAARRAGGGE